VEEAEYLGVQVMQICKKTIGEEHSVILMSMIHLAQILKSQSQDSQAVILRENAANLQKQRH